MTGFILLTSKCNMQCEYCFYNINFMKKQSNDMTTACLERSLDFCQSHGCEKIQFTGGEVFTVPSLLRDAINKAKARKFDITVSTNLMYLIKKQIPNYLEDINILAISIHIDRNTQENYFDIIKKTLFQLKQKGIRCRLIFTVSAVNYYYLQQVRVLAESFNFPLMIQLVYVGSADNDIKNAYSLSKLSANQLLELKQGLFNWVGDDVDGITYCNKLSEYLDSKQMQLNPCRAGADSFIIKPDGTVFPCFYREDIVLGNVMDDFRNIQRGLHSFSSQVKKCADVYCICKCLRPV